MWLAGAKSDLHPTTAERRSHPIRIRRPSTMLISDDADPDILIDRLAAPLLPADRAAFRAAAEDALTRVPCLGEGAIYRAVRVRSTARPIAGQGLHLQSECFHSEIR